jgi:GAF domain-containing protein
MGDAYDSSVPGAGDLLSLLLETQHVDAFLQSILERTVKEIDDSLAGGLTTRQQNRYLTVASTGPLANLVDQLQYRQRSGPCLHALDHGEEVLVDVMSEDGRWGDFRWNAVTHGVQSSLSVPVVVRDRVVAALNLYAPMPRAFEDGKRAATAAFADAAATAIGLALRLAEQQRLTEQLQQALVSRAVIDQALGIIMSGQKCDADEAFDILRNASQSQNVKVRTVAARLVQAVTGKPPVPPAAPGIRI